MELPNIARPQHENQVRVMATSDHTHVRFSAEEKASTPLKIELIPPAWRLSRPSARFTLVKAMNAAMKAAA
jgi:hypothetical protein